MKVHQCTDNRSVQMTDIKNRGSPFFFQTWRDKWEVSRCLSFSLATDHRHCYRKDSYHSPTMAPSDDYFESSSSSWTGQGRSHEMFIPVNYSYTRGISTIQSPVSKTHDRYSQTGDQQPQEVLFLVYQSGRYHCPEDGRMFTELRCRGIQNVERSILLLTCHETTYPIAWPSRSTWAQPPSYILSKQSTLKGDIDALVSKL